MYKNAWNIVSLLETFTLSDIFDRHINDSIPQWNDFFTGTRKSGWAQLSIIIYELENKVTSQLAELSWEVRELFY